MFDVMRDLTRDGVDPVQVVVPSHILVNIPQPAPLNDAKFKLGYIDSLFMRLRKDAHDLWDAADVVAEEVFGLDFVRATRKWPGWGLPSSFTRYGRLVTLMIQIWLLAVLIRKSCANSRG